MNPVSTQQLCKAEQAFTKQGLHIYYHTVSESQSERICRSAGVDAVISATISITGPLWIHPQDQTHCVLETKVTIIGVFYLRKARQQESG